eukprot:TRINITY_DN3491_c0_g1_i1.p1 TRINITY_DN3491_c0_g1~~TRINITY_DN3491_c0_g1_i1.p1  ORF type:complete len:195 (+),score=24.10 TRINITY_DN3491_c0_g1_i1:142-726(+)
MVGGALMVDNFGCYGVDGSTATSSALGCSGALRLLSRRPIISFTSCRSWCISSCCRVRLCRHDCRLGRLDCREARSRQRTADDDAATAYVHCPLLQAQAVHPEAIPCSVAWLKFCELMLSYHVLSNSWGRNGVAVFICTPRKQALQTQFKTGTIIICSIYTDPDGKQHNVSVIGKDPNHAPKEKPAKKCKSASE